MYYDNSHLRENSPYLSSRLTNNKADLSSLTSQFDKILDIGPWISKIAAI